MHEKQEPPAKPPRIRRPGDTITTASTNGTSGGSWNSWIASRLHEAGDLLAQQGANPFRAGAYHRAANALSNSQISVAETFAAGGLNDLIALPHIGQSIASAIAEMLRTGRWAQLERLRGALDPEQLFLSVPGIGPKLSELIHDHLHVDTLEALELAAHDGRLDTVPGIGARRLAMIRQGLAEMLTGRRPAAPTMTKTLPNVDLILDVDREYVRKAAADQLRKIRPRRFSSKAEPWLPILHTERADWHFTALYSNTARAHQLGRTKDWVVIYFHNDHELESQCTVVREHFGSLRGRRVVRGREAECADHYAGKSSG